MSKTEEAISKPDPQTDIDWSRVKETAVSGLEQSIKDKYQDDDLKTYVYEAVMEAVYGKDFFKWRNQQDW